MPKVGFNGSMGARTSCGSSFKKPDGGLKRFAHAAPAAPGDIPLEAGDEPPDSVIALTRATIVRSVLVPASMVLLGDRNWYLPVWLHWLPDLRIEGAPAPRPVARPEAGLAD